jgi:hypothetical protein
MAAIEGDGRLQDSVDLILEAGGRMGARGNEKVAEKQK